MFRHLFLPLIFLVTFSQLTAQKTDKKLQKKISALIQNFNGDVGIYVKDIRRNRVVAINADSIFPTASMIKVPILVGVFDKINRGELQYEQQLEYKDSLLYAGSDILGAFKNSEKVSLAKVIMLMLTTSDNTASLWLQSLAGTGIRINEIMDSIGLINTRINSRTPGRENNRSAYGWGQTTPKEMVLLFEKLYQRNLFSPRLNDRVLRVLGRNYWDDQSLAEVPPTIEVFSKNGAVNASRSETLLVNAPNRPYIFSIITKNNKDESWGDENEAWVLAKKLSKLLWKYYEPKYKF